MLFPPKQIKTCIYVLIFEVLNEYPEKLSDEIKFNKKKRHITELMQKKGVNNPDYNFKKRDTCPIPCCMTDNWGWDGKGWYHVL